MSLKCNIGNIMALNDTSSLALLASFRKLPAEERERIEAGLSAHGREVAEAIRRLQIHNGFLMSKASPAERVAELYLNWADGATVKAEHPAPQPNARKK